MPQQEIVVEICVDSVESAIAAERGGADRIELCSDLLEGGITPSAGLLAQARHSVGIGIFVMIRPRGGDFCYTPAEFAVMREDVRQAFRLGADGLVLGVLHRDGCVDLERTHSLVALAYPMPVTFHRAIDMTPDPVASLEDAIGTGATRVLTSGGAPQAAQGAAVIAEMVTSAAGRVGVMAGGGIVPHTIRAVAAATGATEFHASLRTAVPSPVEYRRSGVEMGRIHNAEYRRYRVREEDVRELRQALREMDHSPVQESGRTR